MMYAGDHLSRKIWAVEMSVWEQCGSEQSDLPETIPPKLARKAVRTAGQTYFIWLPVLAYCKRQLGRLDHLQ